MHCFQLRAAAFLLALLGAQRAWGGQPLLHNLRTRAGAGAPKTPPSGPRVGVKLQRVSALSGGAGGAGSVDGAGFYVGSVMVGNPQQEFSVLFDTAAGNVILPSAECLNTTCLERRRYAPRESTSAEAIYLDGRPVMAGDSTRDVMELGFSQVDLGEGDVVGDLAQDFVCLGSRDVSGSNACAKVGIIAATSMSEVPFRAMPHDGSVGLGLDGLTATSPLFMFMRRLVADSEGLLPQFSIALRGQWGELTFGGPSLAYPPASPPAWFPVMRPEEGYWQVRIEAVRVGNRTVDACGGGCRGIVDTGASRLGVPAELAPKLGLALAAAPVPGEGCRGPDLHLVLAGGYALTLGAEDYAGPACGKPRIVPLSIEPREQFAGIFVLGESVLRRYDTMFDAESMRLGFSPAMPRAVRLGPPTEGAAERTHGVSGVATVISV